MVKSVSAGLTTALDADVTSLAMCVEIERDDGRVYRMTNHDNDLTVSGLVYRSDIPFNISAISSTAGLAVDNTELTLALDGTTFIAADFQSGAFRNATITVFLTKFTDTSVGRMTLRKGWFGETTFNQQGHVSITVVGLLKVLDLTIGRLYQPACDADLGDKRCRVAIDNGQARAFDNVYRVNDWVHVYDAAAMTAISLTNPKFEADGPRSTTQAITGWSKSDVSSWIVTNLASGTADYALDGGTLSLFGSTFSGDHDAEQFVYQDVDLAAAGISTADIDAGRVSCLFSAAMAVSVLAGDKPRLRVEFMNAVGEIIDRKDTRYLTVYAEDTWERHHVGGPIIAGARTARIYLYAYIPGGSSASTVAFDDVTAHWWDHTIGNPYNSTIHKVARIFSTDTAIDTWGNQNAQAVSSETYLKRPRNPSFEVVGLRSNSDSNATAPLGNWLRAHTTGDFWKIVQTLGGISSPLGSYMLQGGDNGSGTQSTYAVYQNMKLLADWGIQNDVVDLGQYVGLFQMTNVWNDTTSAASVVLVWKNSIGGIISTDTVIDWTTAASSPLTSATEGRFAVPIGARSVDIYLYARSPAASSSALVAFDDIRMYLINACAANSADAEYGQGVSTTVFDYTADSYTFDGNLIWKAHTHHVAYDTVATVTDKKNFTASTIAGGADGYFNTALIRWISGANAGRKNVVRTWTDSTKAIKTYFDQIEGIQVGDRFQIIAPCFRRFTEDCVVRFDNAINFRGFPFLPGRRG